MSSVELNLIKKTEEYVLEVELIDRVYAADEKLAFSILDAQTYLKERSLEHSGVISGDDLVLRNYGAYPRQGTFIFRKNHVEQQTKATQAPKKRASSTRAKKAQPAEQKEPKRNIRDRVKKITQKSNAAEKE